MIIIAKFYLSYLYRVIVVTRGMTVICICFRQLSDDVVFRGSGATFNDVFEHRQVLQDAAPAGDDRMVSPQNEIYEIEITFFLPFSLS